MRLSNDILQIIKQTSEDIFGSTSVLYLFGSKADDTKKGGDIDLYLETDLTENIIAKKIDFLVNVKKLIGGRKIDLVINNHQSDKLIYKIAKETGIKL